MLPNGWTDWAEIFGGHSLVTGGVLYAKKVQNFQHLKKIFFFEFCFPRATPGPSASLTY